MVAWSPCLSSCRGKRPSFRQHREDLWRSQEGKCFFCGRACRNPEKRRRGQHEPDLFTVDHVLPRYRGGNDQLTNLVGSCHHCNWMRNVIERLVFCGYPLCDENLSHPELFPVVREDELPYLMRMLEKEPT